MKYLHTLIISLSIILAGCGSSNTPEVIANSKPVRVEQRGDSITNQAGQILADYLPAGSDVINLGVDATIAQETNIPVFQLGTIYTFSYGANECMRNISPESYRLSLNDILHRGRGFALVLEAPWRILASQCNPNIELYRDVVVNLGKQYNVPVVIENDQSHIGDELHIPEAHTRARAQLLAAAILKL